MASQPVNFSDGLPETVLPVEDQAVSDAIAKATNGAQGSSEQVATLENIVADSPRSLAAWAALGDAAPSTMQRYAAYRVGYHRGLDALRAAGWRGSGYVRSGKGGNDGFLRCLEGLGATAAEIGESDEADRIAMFRAQLDPVSTARG